MRAASLGSAGSPRSAGAGRNVGPGSPRRTHDIVCGSRGDGVVDHLGFFAFELGQRLQAFTFHLSFSSHPGHPDSRPRRSQSPCVRYPTITETFTQSRASRYPCCSFHQTAIFPQVVVYIDIVLTATSALRDALPQIITDIICETDCIYTMPASNNTVNSPWQRRLRRLFWFIGAAGTFYYISSYALDRMREARIRAVKDRKQRDL